MQVKANLNAINNISKMQEVAANNVANVNSNGFKASRAVQSGDTLQISPEARAAMQSVAGEELSTADPAQDMVKMSMHTSSLAANLTAIQTQDEMNRTLLDIKK